MPYQILPENLQPTADRVIQFLRNDYGVRNIVVEEPIDGDVDWRPTISGNTQDHHIICVEVTNAKYSESLDKAVLQCINRGLPVRLYIAFPSDDVSDKSFRKTTNEARDRGIGIIEVRRTCKITHAAIALSLKSLRPVTPKQFVAKRRQAVLDAQETFLNGDPPKGCARVYDEIESLSRALAKRAARMEWWTTKANLDNQAWSSLMESFIARIDLNALNKACRGNIQKALLNQVLALASPRNDSAHKPKNRVQLIKRDSQLRTRFEHAVDVLAEFDAALRPLRL